MASKGGAGGCGRGCRRLVRGLLASTHGEGGWGWPQLPARLAYAATTAERGAARVYRGGGAGGGAGSVFCGPPRTSPYAQSFLPFFRVSPVAYASGQLRSWIGRRREAFWAELPDHGHGCVGSYRLSTSDWPPAQRSSCNCWVHTKMWTQTVDIGYLHTVHSCGNGSAQDRLMKNGCAEYSQ